MTDDQDDQDSLDAMPKVKALLQDKGTRFTNSFVINPLCCSSRASFLTGQASHNNGVWQNARNSNGFDGGYGALLSTEGNTLPVWLKAAGYRTGLIGKFLNQYGLDAPATHVPPGWDTWNGLVDPYTYSYYDYYINENGTLVHFGSAPEDYQTDVLSRLALVFLDASAASTQPFFLWVTPLAPHAAEPGNNLPVPGPKYTGIFASLSLPQRPSFNETDLGDKPQFMQILPSMSAAAVALSTDSYRKRREALLSVDDMVAQLIDRLSAQGKLANTYFIFTSDNGYFQGQHRLPIEKRLAYEEAVRVPLIVAGPNVAPGVRQDGLVTNTDLTATIVDLAGASAGRPLDGRSIVPLFRGNAAPWRSEILLEGTSKIPFDTTFYGSFSAVRTKRFKYVEHVESNVNRTSTGGEGVLNEVELYDLASDPFELQSRHADPVYAPVMATLKGELARLRGCKGADCWVSGLSIDSAAVSPLTPVKSEAGKASASTRPIPAEPGELEETNLSAAEKDRFYRLDGNAPPSRESK